MSKCSVINGDKPLRDTRLAYCAGLVMALVFGFSFLFSKRALQYLSPMVLLCCRYTVAAVTMTLLRLCKVIRVDYRRKPLLPLLVLALLYPGLAAICEVVGLQYTTSAQAGIISGASPAVVSFIGVFVLRERLTLKQWLFICCSVAGVALSVSTENDGGSGTLLGNALLAASMILGAVEQLMSRKCSKFLTPVEITYGMVLCGTVVFGSVAVLQGIAQKNLSQSFGALAQHPAVLFDIFCLGVIASVVAFFCMNYALRRLKAAKASIFLNLATVVSVVAGVTLWHESISVYQIIGCGFIVLGVWGISRTE